MNTLRKFFKSSKAGQKRRKNYERAPTQVFSCEFCENFKNTFFHRTLLLLSLFLAFLVFDANEKNYNGVLILT